MAGDESLSLAYSFSFVTRFGIPRQPGLSLWEGASTARFPGATAPSDHRPANLRIESDQGIFSARVEP